MLLAIRDRATGWIAWIIVILLIIPFALWGIQEYLGGGSEPVVAEVEGREITKNTLSEQVERVLRNADERPGPEEVTQLRREVLDTMIAETVLVENARDAGMRIPAEQINANLRQIPAFQVDGRFDQQRYLEVLAANRIQPEQFWEQERRNLLRQQLLGAVGESAFATRQEVDEFLRLRDRQVALSYIPIAVTGFLDTVQVGEQEIQRYYEANAEQFKTPAQVKLKYLKLDPAALMASIPVSEAQLREMFEQRQDSLFQPEQLRAAHILIAVPQDAGADAVAEARARAQQVRKQLAAGEDFAALARRHSDDQASAAQGGDLGAISPGTRSESFELALAELEQGQVSEPVRTPKGFEIIKLVERIPAGRPSFEQARQRLEQEYRRQQAEEQFYRESETLYDLTYENPLSLDVAAKALDLKIQETDWIGRSRSAEGLGAQPEVLRAAFDDELLNGGDLADAVNSKLIELKSGDDQQLNPVVVFRVADYRPSELKPLEQVRAQIAARLRNRAARDQAQERAEAMLARLQAGETLAAVADAEGVERVEAGLVKRNDPSQPAPVLDTAFSLGRVEDGQARYATASLPGGGTAVLAVTQVQDGNPEAADDNERKFIERLLSRAAGTVETGALIDDMRARADVEVNEEVLRRGDEN